MNIKKQFSIRSLGTPTIFSGQNIFNLEQTNAVPQDPSKTCYNIYINGQIIAENVEINPSLIKTDPNLYPLFKKEDYPDRQERDIFMDNLNLINGRLNGVHKELTYWDLYKISASVNSKEEFYSVFASLAIGHSMVINCSTFSLNGITYHRGDVIVKINENDEIKIDSVATGIYYPQSLIHDNENDNYTITYKYTSAIPSESGQVPNPQGIVPSGTPNTELPFNIRPSYAQYNTIYGVNSTGNSEDNYSVEFDIVKLNNQIVKPVIKIFTVEDEEIFEDFTVTIVDDVTTHKIKVTNWKNGPAAYIQVK